MIWLIGYKGLLGSAVLEILKNTNLHFFQTDSKADVSDYTTLESIALQSSEKITHIINCSGYTNVDKAENEKLLAEKVNVTGPENLAKLSNKLNATLIHISSDYVFSGNNKSPILESEKTDPISVYGKTKASGDDKIIKKAKKYYILRTSWLFGGNRKNFVTTMINLFNNKNQVKVVNDQIGSPTYSRDLANVIVKIIKKEIEENNIPYGIYNFSSQSTISWYDFAVEIKKQGEKLDIVKNSQCILAPCSSKEYITDAKRPAYSVLCKDKISKTLNIKIPDWKSSLGDYLQTLI